MFFYVSFVLQLYLNLYNKYFFVSILYYVFTVYSIVLLSILQYSFLICVVPIVCLNLI